MTALKEEKNLKKIPLSFNCRVKDTTKTLRWTLVLHSLLVELSVLICNAVILVKQHLRFLSEMLKKAHKRIGNQMFNLGYEDFVIVFIKHLETTAPSYSEGLRGSSVKDMPSAKEELTFLKRTVEGYSPLEQRRKKMFA